MQYQERYEAWLHNPYFDEMTRQELAALDGNEKEKEDRFYTDLVFGTGGLRGIIGAGTNRINIYTIRRATQGLADYILSIGEKAKEQGVAIAYDSRFQSDTFALEAALVLVGNGIRVFLFDELRPTPELSFSVRTLKAVAGIVITASHNPAQYNGYKVYWEDGGQIPPERADEVLNRIDAITDFSLIRRMAEVDAREKKLLIMIGADIDRKYLDAVKTLCIQPELLKKVGKDFKLVYTPIHGSGNKLVRRILFEAGLSNVIVVKEQELPDPAFSTVKSPNPEEREAFTIAIALAESLDIDLIIGTDPDCDRVGVVVRNPQGAYVVLTGNQIGCLLLHYILSQKKAMGMLPNDARVIKTIVTTEMARKICEDFQVEIIDVLTGFKFIGEKIQEFEDTGRGHYLFGFEESYGYLAGTFVRDKDGVITSMLVAETAAYYQSKGLSLYEGLQELFKQYGYFKEKLTSFTLQGKEGVEKISKIMENLRTQTPDCFGNRKIVGVRDYKNSQRKDLILGNIEALSLPLSDVLYFEIEDGSWVCVRPSGTEPKIKIYFAVQRESEESSVQALEYLEHSVLEQIQALID